MVNGWTCLGGVIVATVSHAVGDTLFDLPAGYRPGATARRFALPTGPNTGTVTIDVTSAGRVGLASTMAPPVNLSLDGVRFAALS
jgi:hypothetical protein